MRGGIFRRYWVSEKFKKVSHRGEEEVHTEALRRGDNKEEGRRLGLLPLKTSEPPQSTRSLVGYSPLANLSQTFAPPCLCESPLFLFFLPHSPIPHHPCCSGFFVVPCNHEGIARTHCH